MSLSYSYCRYFVSCIRTYNTIQYNTTRHATTQYNTIQYNTIQYNTLYIYIIYILYNYLYDYIYICTATYEHAWITQIKTHVDKVGWASLAFHSTRLGSTKTKQKPSWRRCPRCHQRSRRGAQRLAAGVD